MYRFRSFICFVAFVLVFTGINGLFASLNATASVGSFEAGGSFQVARIYFLGSGTDTYVKPHVDEKDPLAKPDCSSAYKYVCNAPKVGVGTSCDGKYATPCVCAPGYNKDCSTDPTLIGQGSSCDRLYEECSCGYSYYLTCGGKLEGVGNACTLDPSNPLYQSCKCKGIYSEDLSTCSGDWMLGGDSCTDSSGTKWESCICNPTAYPEMCQGTGEKGVLPQCAGNGGFKDCECDAALGYDKTCDDDSGQEGTGNVCNADDKPKYQTCKCKDEYDLTCDGEGEEGSLADAQDACGLDASSKKYQACKCNSSYQSLCNGEGEKGVGDPCEADGTPKYQSCVCNIDTGYTKLCDGEGEEGVGGACVVEGTNKFTGCKCKDEYSQLCNENGQVGKNTACTADGTNKYKECECEPQYQECPCGEAAGANSCTVGGVTKWNACISCCNDDCSAGFSKTDPGGIRETETTGCGTTCYKACGGSYTWDSGNCTAPAVLGGGTCGGKYGSCSCPSGYSTAYQSVSDCGNGTGGANGWIYSSGGSVGGLKCGKCNERNGCSSGYSQSVTSCTSPKTLSTSGYYGSQACGLCSCPAGYTQTCGADYFPNGVACDGKYTGCTCDYPSVGTCAAGCKTYKCGSVCIECNPVSACNASCSSSNGCGCGGNWNGNFCISSACTTYYTYGNTATVYIPEGGLTVTHAAYSHWGGATSSGGPLVVNGTLALGLYNNCATANTTFYHHVTVNGVIAIGGSSKGTFTAGLSGNYTCQSCSTGAAIACPSF